MKIISTPLLIALTLFGLRTVYAFDADNRDKLEARKVAAQQARDAEQQAKKAQEARERHTFAAQVVGVQWLSPVVRRDYSTEWNLLWTQGAVKPNANDELVREDPKSFTTVQSVSGLAFNTTGNATLEGFFERYTVKTFLKYRDPYVLDERYFYTVKPTFKHNWREVQGIHVQAALPKALSATAATDFIRKEITDIFSINNPRFSSKSLPPDVHVTQGGPEAGFHSLDAALDYLEQHPDKTAWVMSFDARSFPKDSQMDESATLLILAHPSLKTEREPLAWIHRVSVKNAADYTTTPTQGPAIQQAWSAALQDATDRGGLITTDIHYVIHDAGRMKTEDGSERTSTLSRALYTNMPDLDVMKQVLDSRMVLGDLGAGTALTNMALGIAYAHHKNTPVLIANTTEPNRARALVIRPPANPKPYDPNKNWFRARGEGTAYLPWWGRRLDAPKTMQGWSE